MSKPLGPYTPVVRAGDLLFVSGQLGAKDGELVSGDTVDQLQQAFTNLAALLEANGSALTDAHAALAPPHEGLLHVHVPRDGRVGP